MCRKESERKHNTAEETRSVPLHNKSASWSPGFLHKHTHTHTQSGCCSHHCDWPNSASRASSLRWSIIKPPFATRDLLLRFRGESFPASARPPGRLSAAAHPLLCCSVELHVCVSLSHHSEREAAATEVTPEVRRLLRSSLGNKEWTCLFLVYIHSFSRSVMENDLQRRKNTNTSV